MIRASSRAPSSAAAERTRAQRELNALSWVGRIRDALDDDRLVLYSQPIVALAQGFHLGRPRALD